MTVLRFASSSRLALASVLAFAACTDDGAALPKGSLDAGPPGAPLDGGASDAAARPPDASALDGGPDGGPGGGRPDGGHPDAGGTPTDGCDDGNPCTIDTVLPSGCLNEPAPDGSPCDDGDFCTLGDQCERGVCEAKVDAFGPLEVQGRIHGFATSRGGALPLANGRFLFMDSPWLDSAATVVRLGASGVDVQRRTPIPGLALYDYTEFKAAHLGNDRVAWIEGQFFDQELVIADVLPDGRVEERGRHVLDPALPAPRSVVHTGQHLWMCGNDFFTGGTLVRFDVADPDAPAFSGQMLLGSDICGTLAANESGSRIYVNTSSGVRWVDTTGPVPSLEDPIHGVAAPFVDGDRLYLNASDRIVVLRESDWSPLSELDVAADGIHPGPSGLWVELTRTVSGGTESVVALYDPLAAPDSKPIDEVILQFLPLSATGEPTSLVSNGEFLVHSFMKRIFRFDGTSIRELSHPAQGGLGRLDGRGTSIHVRSRFSAHRVDAEDPTAPFLAAGGPHGADPRLTWELGGVRRLVPELDPPGFRDPNFAHLGSHRSSYEVRFRTYDASMRPTDVGAFDIEGGKAMLGSSGDWLYRIEATSSERAAARFDRIAPPVPGSGSGPTIVRSFVLEPTPEIPTLDRGTGIAFAVDPHALMATVSVGVFRGMDDAEAELYWIDLERGEVIATERLDHEPRSMQLSGARLFYTTGLEAVFRERHKGQISRLEFGDYLSYTLGFDGRSAYFTKSNQLVSLPWAATDPADATTVTLSGPPSSVTSYAEGIAVGSPAEVVLAAPACN